MPVDAKFPVDDVDSIHFYSILFSGEMVKRVVSSIILPIFTLLGSVVTACVVYKNHWKYMSILRKIFIEKKPSDKQIDYELCKTCCGFFQVCCWCSCIFCCQCCKYESKNVSQNQNYELRQWGQFVEKTISITEPTLNDMIESYINCKYNHRYYCYKNGNMMCPPYECKHTTSIIKERLLRYPTLYLIVLDFKKSKAYEEIKKEPKEHRDIQYNQPEDYLKFIFRSVIEGAADRYEIRKAYQNIEVSLEDRFKHLCLVLMDFPNNYSNSLEPEEKFLLEAVQKAHKEYNIQLIYCLE